MQAHQAGIILLAAAASLACATDPSPDRAPATFPAGIYYSRQVDTIDRLPQIFRIAPTGGAETPLSLGAGVHFDPVVSPDGQYLAFGRQQAGVSAIFLTRPGDTATTALTPDSLFASKPAWSPSGHLLAFTAYLHGNADVYVISPDGTGLTRLTSSPGRQGYPTWLDDSSLAINTDSSGISQIEVMGASTSSRHLISGDPDTITQANGNPAWSPGAGRLAFVRSGAIPISVWTMDRDGANARPVLSPLGSGWYSWPAWSPNGAHLVAIAGGFGTGAYLVTTNLAGNQVDTILAAPAAILSVSWAP